MSNRKALLSYTEGVMWKFYARILHQLLITSFVNTDMKFSYSQCFREVACEILQKIYKVFAASQLYCKSMLQNTFFLKRLCRKPKLNKKTVCAPCFICCLQINLSFTKRRRENSGLSGATANAKAQGASCNEGDPTGKTPKRRRGACHHGAYTSSQLQGHGGNAEAFLQALDQAYAGKSPKCAGV